VKERLNAHLPGRKRGVQAILWEAEIFSRYSISDLSGYVFFALRVIFSIRREFF